PVLVTPDLQPDRAYPGRVTEIGYMATQESVYRNPDLRRYKARIELDDDNLQFKQGSTAQAQIILDIARDVPAVPNQSIVTRFDPQIGRLRHAVWVQGPNDASLRNVELGLRNPMLAQVTQGLEPGERVLLPPTDTPADIPPLDSLDRKAWIRNNLSKTGE
ncbi:MAG: efflux RND transporter periplasmic adaptor subunit, partial [Planctomycetota bacterium]